ncbi:MAG: hypothetical protein R3Y43_04295 [Alphaproteobacteria bacterium]
MKIKQIYTSPIKCFDELGNEQLIKEKEWTLEELGSKQISPIWRHYKEDIWVSNIGYVAQINPQRAQSRFLDKADEKCNDFIQKYKNTDVNFNELFYEERLLIKVCTFIPIDSNVKNKYGDKAYGVELYVEQLKESLHSIVAKTFLNKKEGDGKAVHHIDNNSYNNSVTNLICIDGKIHNPQSDTGKTLHPCSVHKTDKQLQYEKNNS